MLDGRGTILLNRINELCRDGNYKVVERADLLSAFPSVLAQGAEGLDGIIGYLAEHEYIDVKYADRENGVYCLYPLPAGRLYIEKSQTENDEKKKNLLRFFLSALLGGFVGAAFGSGMVSLFLGIG